MDYVIGIDEAGYGPNLGPLVIAGVVWQVADGNCDDVALSTPCVESKNSGSGQLWISDSKKIHAQKGLAGLEHPVLAISRFLSGQSLESYRTILDWIGSKNSTWGEPSELSQLDLQLPQSIAASELSLMQDRLAEEWTENVNRPVAIRARVIFPGSFNSQCDKLGNKSSLLSVNSLELAKELCEEFTSGAVRIHCDKHGGRDKYSSLLQHVFDVDFPLTLKEGKEESRYQWSDARGNREIRFRVQGERWAETALASLTAKYLRELSMEVFNGFWLERLPNLVATAGYPEDAKRFWSEIEAKFGELKLSKRDWWRDK